MGFPGSSGGKVSACNAGAPSSILCQEDPLEQGMAIPPVFLPGQAQQMTVHGITKSQTQLIY